MLAEAIVQNKHATHTCSLLPTLATGLSDCVCRFCEAPFYCVCQGQGRERYVRNSHVSYPHSSIGAAVPLPIETQKANFYLSADAGWLFLLLYCQAITKAERWGSGLERQKMLQAILFQKKGVKHSQRICSSPLFFV